MPAKKYHIPNRLKKHRKIFGYTQEYVREKLKLTSASIVSNWELGLERPSLINLLKLSTLYRTSVDALFIDMKNAIREDLQLDYSDTGTA